MTKGGVMAMRIVSTAKGAVVPRTRAAVARRRGSAATMVRPNANSTNGWPPSAHATLDEPTSCVRNLSRAASPQNELGHRAVAVACPRAALCARRAIRHRWTYSTWRAS